MFVYVVMRIWDIFLLLVGELDFDCGLLLIIGMGKVMCILEMMIENWIELFILSSYIVLIYLIKFVVNFRVKKEFGELGVFFVKNFYCNEFFLKEIIVEVLNCLSLYFICDLCVYNVDYYVVDCVFFINKVIFLLFYGYFC